LNCKEIADFINRKYIPIEETNEPTFDRLATELQRLFVHNHRGRVGGRDQAHNVLAMAIICSLWCGWLTQAKANSGAYSEQGIAGFKKLIDDAFEFGRQYSEVEP
jgi:hypothetical protein